jgi:hypothetical protein
MYAIAKPRDTAVQDRGSQSIAAYNEVVWTRSPVLAWRLMVPPAFAAGASNMQQAPNPPQCAPVRGGSRESNHGRR